MLNIIGAKGSGRASLIEMIKDKTAVVKSMKKAKWNVLVVSALDGVLPETVELIQKLDHKKTAVVISKADLAEDPTLLELVEMEIRSLFPDNGKTIPFIVGSTHEDFSAQTIEKLTSL